MTNTPQPVEFTIELVLTWPEMSDIKEELEDPNYASRRHGSRATYALGCHGPLCRKKERDRARERNQKKAQREGRPYIEGDHRKYDRDDLMDAVFVWHVEDLAMRRIQDIKTPEEKAV